ncbi:pilus assembly PilX family protein [Massilia putida]|uniref:pilus assembly PilX family protein n=1 Tax=Massilia putida TaxID=1141883 RepID=UPI000950CBAD|nr:PilX N-terminal domain-containing pilus assembly protein [Massilia putida]
MKTRRSESGLALVCALMLMLAAMVIGLAVVRGGFVLLAAARNERDRDVAWAAAEAALRDAEHDIAGAADAPPDRAAHFSPAGAGAFVDGCGRGEDDRGLCRARSPPAWQTLDLTAGNNPALVPYGRFTGATLAIGHGVLPARLPAYVIERIAPPGATARQGGFYRITAIGFGSRIATRVVLQSLYRLPPPNGNADGHEGGNGNGNAHGDGHDDGDGNPTTRPQQRQLPAGRIGWGEIANWAELHAHTRP